MKLKYSIIFILITVGCFAFAQDTTFSEKYFKLINTFNSIDEVYSAHPELKPKPPHIVINDDEVVFYDDNGAVINTMPVIKGKEAFINKTNDNNVNGGIYFEYKTVSDKVLLITKYNQIGIENRIPVQRELFNNRGEFIVKIEPYNYIIKISSNNKYILTYNNRVKGKIAIFNYNSGELITDKLVVYKDAEVSFCENQRYIKIKNFFGGYIKIVEINGKEVFNVNTRELLKGVVFDFFFLDDINKVLISTFPQNRLYLMNLNSQLLWEKENPVIENCFLVSNENRILLYARDEIIDPLSYNKYITLLDISNGNIISNIICNDVSFINTQSFIVGKGGHYYEYKIN